MKYIRTAIDTIEILVYEDTDGNIVTEHYDFFGNRVVNHMKSEWIKKRADNIEELCDELIIIDKASGRHLRYALDIWQRYSLKEKLIASKHIEVYGAVWTKRGLIYVAKMNENGELELFHEIY